MNKINDWFATASKWKIFFTFFIFYGVFSWLMMGMCLGDLETTVSNPHWKLKSSIAVAFIFALLSLAVVGMGRLSSKYWKAAAEFENKLKDANTPEQLNDLYTNGEFQNLRKLAQGQPHFYENRRLFTILETKYEILKDSNVKTNH